jgi:glycosyltransferase involved in cell wall biosynthesis
MDEAGIKTWEGDITEEYDVCAGHTVGAWSHEGLFKDAKSKGQKTVEIMHSIYKSPTPPELVDMFVGVSHLATDANLQMPATTTLYPYIPTAKFGWEKGNKIGKLCRFASEKCPLEFVEIAKQFPQEQFIMAGDGPLMPEVKRLAPPNLELPGMIRKFPEFYDQLKLFVHPARDETCSVAVAMAQISGLPIICSDIPGLRESTGGWADYVKDIPEFVAIVRDFLEIPDSFRDSALGSQTWAEHAFSTLKQWDAMITGVCA